MCVIFCCHETRPSEEMVKQAFEANSAGAGIAWRENGFVKWEKGLELEGILAKCKEVPIPFVAHFRIPTVGGKNQSLCHPFPIERNAPLALKGQTKGYVLFHNGHWSSWKDTTMKAAVQMSAKLPSGKWSDSRAMAWMAAHYGLGVLEFIDEKAIAFGPTDTEVASTGWMKVDNIWVSNKHWENHNRWNGTGTFVGGHHTPYAYQYDRKKETEEFDMAHLPESYHGGGKKKAFNDDRAIIIDVEGDEKVGSEKGTKIERRRVTTGPLPFKEAQIAWLEGRLSKKQWKKAQRRNEVEMWKATRNSTLPAVIVKH